jgi:MFS family permease
VGFGLLFSGISSLVTVVVPGGLVGKSSGLLGSVQGGGIFAAPFIYGFFLDMAYFRGVFLAAAALGVAGVSVSAAGWAAFSRGNRAPL